MIYNLDKEYELNLEFDYEKIYKDVVDCVLSYFKCPYDCEISLLLVDNNSIREINGQTRGIDKATDVLSFPNAEFEEAGNFELIDDTEDYFEPDTGEFILGDIVLSLDKVVAQAEEYGHSSLREYAFLLTHSMLHLIGFDHIEDDDRCVMEEKQSVIMDILGIHR